MIDIKIPHLAEGITAGTIVNIFVSKGDKVEKDQDILEIETEKAVATLPSPTAGTVSEVLVQSGDKVNEGQVVIKLAVVGELIDKRSLPPRAMGPDEDSEFPKLAMDERKADAKLLPTEPVKSDEFPKPDKDESKTEAESPAAASDVDIESPMESAGEKSAAAKPPAADYEGDIEFPKKDAGAKSTRGKFQTPPIEIKLSIPFQDDSIDVRDRIQAPRSALGAPASPAVKKLAYQYGINLSQVQGSKRGGRITLGDLEAYIRQMQLAPLPAESASPGLSRKSRDSRRSLGRPKFPVSTPQPSAPSEDPTRRKTFAGISKTQEGIDSPVDFSKWGPVKRQPLSSLRKKISARLTKSWQNIPCVTQFDEFDSKAFFEFKKKMDELLKGEASGASPKSRQAENESQSLRLTLTALILKAVVKVLKQHPIFNASLDETTEELVLKEYYHLGVAVDTEKGLIVPVLKDVDKKDIVMVSKDLKELAERTRKRKISIAELQGSSFTVSNQGGIGGAHFTPIINAPEVAILGVGRGIAKPVVKGRKVVVRNMVPIALSYDHRVIDGANAARFITDLKNVLENFSEGDLL